MQIEIIMPNKGIHTMLIICVTDAVKFMQMGQLGYF